MSRVIPTSHGSRSPHPILKRDSSPFRVPVLPFAATGGGPHFSPHVHFPPTPCIASTYPAHSPTTYDRKPIIVSPNIVQLPHRGARRMDPPPPDPDGERRGRSRSRSRNRGVGSDNTTVKGSYFHPRAYEACKPEPANAIRPFFDVSMPALVQDLSPSDDSDDYAVTPPGTNVLGTTSLASSTPLRLPGTVPRTRRSSAVELAGGLDSPPLTSLPPPPRPHSNGRGRQESNSIQPERQSRRWNRPSSFLPDKDEGCLGGF